MTAPEGEWLQFVRRRDGMRHALRGGLWFHQHVWKGERMAHLVSSDRRRLLEAGAVLGMEPAWLQHKPLKDPDSAQRVNAWHWDLRGAYFELGLRLASARRPMA